MASASILQKTLKTRSSTNVWMVGQQLPRLDLMSCSNRLPTVGLVLGRLFYDLKTLKLSVSQGCSNVIDEVFSIWFLANIPTTQNPNAVAKLKALYDRYVKLGKNKARKTNRQAELEADFGKLTNELFDVAHASCDKVPSLIKIPDDIAFLEDQRGAMKMTIGPEDIEFKEREEKRQRRKTEEGRRQEKAQKEAAHLSSSNFSNPSDQAEEIHSVKMSSSSDNDPDAEELSISKYHVRTVRSTEKRPVQLAATTQSSVPHTELKRRRLVDNPFFVASLDRTKTTPREAMHIVAPALKAAGVDIDTMSLSTSTIYRARKSVRKSLVLSQKDLFIPSTPLVAHFDGKLLPDSDGRSDELVDRMPIVVSGVNVEKLLAIPKLPISTGESMGQAVIQTLQDWKGVPDWLAGLCFDTTSSNTGIHTGAITVIQRAFDKRLLFLACRHHILEIISAAVFDLFFKSSGPQIALFGRFKEQWKFIDLAKYAAIDVHIPGVKSDMTSAENAWFYQTKADMINFLQNQMSQEAQPRQDYLELVKLSLAILGSDVLGDVPVHFSPPGAYHRARWMAKGIYCLKIYLFREQFKLSAHELQALRRICLFTVTIYVKAWFSAPDTRDAPLNDLCLLQTLESYVDTDRQVSDISLKKMRGHLWYLSEDLIGLALFSDRVFESEKVAMVDALKKPKLAEDVRRVDPTSVVAFQRKTLPDFVTEKSRNLFAALKIDPGFLTKSPSVWHECQDYITAKQKIMGLKVINDCAERAVKLATDFNNAFTHDETQRQLVFQIVEFHRKQMTQPLKKNYKTD